jgi:hypothetical protein
MIYAFKVEWSSNKINLNLISTLFQFVTLSSSLRTEFILNDAILLKKILNQRVSANER